mgnify:CR=1 FL=1
MDRVELYYEYGSLAIRLNIAGTNKVLTYESTELRNKDIAEMDLYLLMHTG